MTEYSGEYNIQDINFKEPYYPILNVQNIRLYNTYGKQLNEFKNLSIVGRLAEYKYYNMEAVILSSFELLKKKYSICIG